MIRRWPILLVLVALLFASLAGCRAASPAASDAPDGTTPSIPANSQRVSGAIIAEGRLVPRQAVDLAFAGGGAVATVQVAEGDLVAAGQVLITLDSAAQAAAVAQAEAAVEASRAALAVLADGAGEPEIAAADAAVAAAEAAVTVAQAQAQATQAGVAAAAAGMADAQAVLDDLAAGATAEELELARLSLERAQNNRWAAQAARDGIGGAVDSGRANDYDLDGAEAAVNVAEANVQIAAIQLAQLQAAPEPAPLARAQAALDVARAEAQRAAANARVATAQVAAAEAALAGARAQAERIRAGASTPQLDQARASVAQAEAALQGAQAALAARTLVAPFGGTVAALDARVGQQAAANAVVARLADLEQWVVETEDLSEVEVVQVAVGQTVEVVADALPDAPFTATVQAISPYFGENRGDVTYTARLAPEAVDPRLRWGMTVVVTFD